MSPEILRIIRGFSPKERALFVQMGGTLPPGMPDESEAWRNVDDLSARYDVEARKRKLVKKQDRAA